MPGAGEPRIGIFSLTNIAPGEELTYDYKFQHLGLANAAKAYRHVTPAFMPCL